MKNPGAVLLKSAVVSDRNTVYARPCLKQLRATDGKHSGLVTEGVPISQLFAAVLLCMRIPFLSAALV